MLGFMSVGPLMLLFSVKTIKEYGGPLGRLWNRLVEPRLDSIARRYVSFAVFAGMLAGALSIPVVQFLNALFFPEVSLAFRPREPMALLTQIAFIQAGLIEELAKNAVGLVFAFLICRAAPTAAAREDRLFLKSTPFLFAGVGLGFALLENSQYIRYYAAMGPGGIFLGRSLIATSAHALLNLYFGLCLLSATRGDFARVALRALVIVVLWHGIYDFFALPPVALSQWLTLVFLCVMVYLALSKMYRLLPELRYRPLRPVHEVEAEQAAMSGGIPSPSDFPSNASTGSGGRSLDTVGSHASANGPSSSGSSPSGPEDSGPQNSARWHERLAVLPAIPDRFPEYFQNDPWRLRFPAGEDQAPYEFSEFDMLSARSLALIGRPGIVPLGAGVPSGGVASDLSRAWATDRDWWCRLFGVDEPHSRWDTSVFAEDATSAFEDLARGGVDLTQTVPFQVLEFRVPNPEAAPGQSPAVGANADESAAPAGPGMRHVFITTGLQELYGRELLVSFSHPHPMVRWFFLNLASMAPDQAPWLREFHAFYGDGPRTLGDPRGWLRFYLTVPMIDPIVAGITTDPSGESRGLNISLTDDERENQAPPGFTRGEIRVTPPVFRAADELPLQILMCAYPDGEYIVSRGVPAYLQTLRHLGYPWQNDFRRPAVDV